jgi:hypothetical protein
VNIKPAQLSKLPDEGKDLILKIIDRLESGKQILPSDVGLLGLSFTCLREKDIAEAFHISDRQVRNWVEAGCPKSAAGYDLYQVHTWLLTRELDKVVVSGDGGQSLKDRKTQEEIAVLQKRQEKMDFEMQQLKDTTIPKEVHERAIIAIIEADKNFDNNSLKRNLAKFRAVPDSEANIMIDQYCIDKSKHKLSCARQAERV